MNSLIIVTIAVVLFIWAYRFYAKRLELLWQVDPKRSTPAYSKYDSVDYIPAKNWLVLFGHHFASIAGAGPIIGPVIAAMLWGWFPALCWVVLGTIFIGGVHDFGSLITSVREGGASIADIAEGVISRKAKITFSLFLWLALILVIAVFAYLCADTFVKEPKIVLPSLGLIPVAMLVGYFLYHLRVNSLLATLFGLLCLTALICWGNILGINAGIKVWLLILLVYCYFASVLPVNLLLQPRDYLSSFLLFFGIAAGYVGLLISHPNINIPPYQGCNSAEGYLWPALFVTVACGAVSGFHAIIASGTTSKQVANERQIKRIGYGAMIAEGLVAVLAIISTGVLFQSFSGAFGMQGNFAALLKSVGPIDIFAKGFGILTERILGKHGPLIAITILNAFILTTLDTATRVGRYLTEELFRIKNRYCSTFLIVILSSALAFSGQWQKIWPAFGASNQLVAALALFVLSCWLLLKKRSVKYTLWPAAFMLLTTVAALVLQAIKYFLQKDTVLLLVAGFLLILAGFMAYEIVKTFLKRRNG